MKLKSIISVLTFAVIMPVDADECDNIRLKARQLFEAKQYEQAKAEYESYLRSSDCPESGEVKKNLEECKRQIAAKTKQSAEKTTTQSASFKLSRNTYTVEATVDNTLQISFISAPAEWHVESLPSWIEEAIGSKDRYTIEFYIDDNSGAQDRTGQIVFKADDSSAKAVCTIKQEGIFIPFSVSNDYIEFTDKKDARTLHITSDYAWRVVSYPDWLSVMSKNNDLSVLCSQNNTESAREDEIIIENSFGKRLTIVVAQDKSNEFIYATPDAVNDDNGAGGTATVTIKASRNWQIDSTPNWCTTQQDGNKLKITMQRNKTGYRREGDVKISIFVPDGTQTMSWPPIEGGDYKTAIIHLRQAPSQQYVELSVSSINEPTGKGGTSTISVDTSEPTWEIVDMPAWCELTAKTYNSFTIHLLNNNGGNAREAQLRVKAGTVVRTLTLKQAARENFVTVSANLVNSSKNGGNITIRVESSGTWRVVNLPDWCHITSQDNNSFTLKVDYNDGAARSATIAVSSAGTREQIKINQD
ncbi:MAG: BACON domain-containing protein [Paludibacteraceae bacterium]|nr:BACON domain-containing protein [Paludibacteraceae bacterium]